MDIKRKRTALILFLIVMLAASALFGCGDKSESEKEQRAQRLEQLKERQKEARQKAAEKKEHAKKASEEKKAAKKKKKKSAENEGKSDPQGKEDVGSQGSDAKEKKASGQASAKKSAKTDNSSGSKSKSSSSSNTAKNSKATCTIKITCSRLVGNKDLDDAQQSRVPKDGIILGKTAVEISSGDSVYDVLKKACKKKKIVLSAENTGLGIYVAGIDGFYEKDAGGESGWKYKVNGKYPNDSAGDVKVKNGDVIEWVYVLEA